MASLVIDENGLVTTAGRFQGRHIDDVMAYLDGLEAAVTNAGGEAPKQPGETEEEKRKREGEVAAQKLADQARNRIDPLQAMTLQRLEQDDEADFAKSVPDYDVYKAEIDKLKNGLALHLRAQKNLHRTLYINVKSNDKRVQSRIFEKIEEKPASPPAEGEAPPPSPGVENPPPVSGERPAARGPKPAPPLAAPTPGGRPAPAAAGAARKPKLVATEKIRSFCRSNRMDVDAYLLKLEDSGQTQLDLDSAGQMGKRENPRSVYDRPRAVRS